MNTLLIFIASNKAISAGLGIILLYAVIVWACWPRKRGHGPAPDRPDLTQNKR